MTRPICIAVNDASGSLCSVRAFSDGGQAGKNVRPPVHKAHPHLLMDVVLVHLGIDLQVFLPRGGVCRPGHRHLRLPVVGDIMVRTLDIL